jgi:porphobilinogen synthase
MNLLQRPRRNRRTAAIRSLTQETHLQASQLILPYFVVEGKGQVQPISSLPGVSRLSVDLLLRDVETAYAAGIRAIDLFPLVPSERKDRYGREALRQGNLIHQAINAVKNAVPEMCVMVDIALDPYTDHGHDGHVDDEGTILNDSTVAALAEMSILCADAGADIIAPSDMMDGRVREIRKALDSAGFDQVGILSYAAKYASAFYGPFRDALQSAPKFGDKKTYQMNPANKREAVLESVLDVYEGADMLLIKPALPYLDVIAEVKKHVHLPVGAYHVSGEYAMVMAAAQNGWIDADKALYETLLSIRRAGADFIFTYAAKRVAQLLRQSTH